MRLALSTLVAVVALAVPGVALGQSAGDNQYVDPFAGQHASPGGGQSGAPQHTAGQPSQGTTSSGTGSSTTGSGTSTGGGSSTTGSGTSAPASGSSTPSSGGSTPSSGTTKSSQAGGDAATGGPASTSSGQLPRTGEPLAPLFALGGLLILGGFALRLAAAPGGRLRGHFALRRHR
jgi:hypothetical protein